MPFPWPSIARYTGSVGTVPLALTMGALLLSCASSTEPKTPGRPASLEIVSGHDQEGVVGQELPAPLVVRVEDDNGQPVPNQFVNWVVASGGGHVFAGGGPTKQDGIAQERWTLGTSTSEAQVLEVRAVDPTTGERLVFARFMARPTAGAPVTMTKASEDAAQTPAGQPVVPAPAIHVADQYGNPVPNATVTFTVTQGNGSVAPANALTDVGGMATTTWTAGTTAGENELTATLGNLPAITFATTGVIGSAARLGTGASTKILDSFSLNTNVKFAGEWMLWWTMPTLMRRNLETGETVTISSSAQDLGDVAENGDVVFASGGQIFRYRDGEVTQLSTRSDLTHGRPNTDGLNTIYRRSSASGGDVVLHTSTGEEVVSTVITGHYGADHGWVAFSKPGTSSMTDVWVRSPTAEERLVARVAGSLVFERIFPDGTLIIGFGSSQRAYSWSAPQPGAFPIVAYHQDTDTRWVDGRLHSFLANSLFVYDW